MKTEELAESEVMDALRDSVKASGSLRSLAADFEVSPAYLCGVLKGKYPLGDRILNPMGIERVETVSYYRVKKMRSR